MIHSTLTMNNETQQKCMSYIKWKECNINIYYWAAENRKYVRIILTKQTRKKNTQFLCKINKQYSGRTSETTKLCIIQVFTHL